MDEIIRAVFMSAGTFMMAIGVLVLQQGNVLGYVFVLLSFILYLVRELLK